MVPHSSCDDATRACCMPEYPPTTEYMLTSLYWYGYIYYAATTPQGLRLSRQVLCSLPHKAFMHLTRSVEYFMHRSGNMWYISKMR